MSKPIVTGLMSYGMSGRIFHAPFIQTHPEFILKAVVERSQKKASEIYPEILSYNSIDELLNDSEIELIIVNTPNHTHSDYAQRALKAGKHVLIEKPAAVLASEVKELYALGREYKRSVMVFQNRRYESGFLSVKEVIESGSLGQLIEVYFRMDRYKNELSPKAFKESEAIPGSGLVYDLGPHLLDNAIALFGCPISFTKTTGTYRETSEVTDYFHFHLVYPNQLNVYITSGLLIAGELPGFVLNGTKGSFSKKRIDMQEDQLNQGMQPDDNRYGMEPAGNEGILTTMDADKKTIASLPSKKGDYMLFFNAVYETIRNQKSFPVTEEDLVCQLEMIAGKA